MHQNFIKIDFLSALSRNIGTKPYHRVTSTVTTTTTTLQEETTPSTSTSKFNCSSDIRTIGFAYLNTEAPPIQILSNKGTLMPDLEEW